MPRIIGPSEYNQLRNQLKVGPTNFDQYFMRSGSNILIKDQYDPKAPTQDIKSLQLDSGRPNIVAGESQTQSQSLGNVITKLLQNYQNIEKYPFAAQGFNAQEEQANRVEATNPNLIGAAPDVQASARSASAAAVQPTITGAEQAGQTFASRLNTFADVITQAQNLQQQVAASEQQAKADAQNMISMALGANPNVFDNADPDQILKLEKQAGYPKGFLYQLSQGIKQTKQAEIDRQNELLAKEAPQTMETNQGIFSWNAQTGEWESTGLKSYVAPRVGAQPSNKQAITDENGNVTGYFNPDTGETVYYDNNQNAEGLAQYIQEKSKSLGMSPTNDTIKQWTNEFNSQQQSSNQPNLSKSLRTAALQISNQFDGEQTVKDYNVAMTGLQALKNLGTASNSPTDDQAFIYAFAKIMDPNSVVRESEYNTVQKYAQSWGQQFGFKANQALAGGSFLSQAAKEKMMKTLQNKVGAIQTSYNNVYNEYVRRINNTTGTDVGAQFLTDYSKAFGDISNQSVDLTQFIR